MQACTEANLFYKIKSISDSIALESDRDSLVLLFLCDSLDTEKNRELFFPEVPKRRLEFRVKGYFYNDKVSINHPYGCTGSGKFQITNIVQATDITEREDYPIDNSGGE